MKMIFHVTKIIPKGKPKGFKGEYSTRIMHPLKIHPSWKREYFKATLRLSCVGTQCGNFITEILSEINFEDSWSAKSAILSHSEALNFDFYEILHFLKAEIDQIYNIIAAEMAKPAVFALREFTTLISRKISVINKSWNFHAVRHFLGQIHFSVN